VTGYKPVPEPRKAGRHYLTLDEWRKLLATARAAGDFEHLLTRLLYECALRASEPGEMRLDHLKRLHLGQLYVARGKGSHTGWQDISKELAALLDAHVRRTYELKGSASVTAAAKKWPALYVFPGAYYRGVRKGISRKTVFNTVKELALQAGLAPSLAHPHALKHSRVQHLFEEAERQGLQAEAALKVIAKIVGHRSAQTSWEFYVSETGAGKKVAVATLKRAMED